MVKGDHHQADFVGDCLDIVVSAIATFVFYGVEKFLIEGVWGEDWCWGEN